VLALSAACLLLVGAMPTKPRDPFAEFHSKSPTRALPGQLATTLADEPTPRCAASLATTSAPHAAAGRSSIRPISRYCSLWRRWRQLMPVNCLLVWRWNHSSLWRAPPASRRALLTPPPSHGVQSRAPEHEQASAGRSQRTSDLRANKYPKRSRAPLQIKNAPCPEEMHTPYRGL